MDKDQPFLNLFNISILLLCFANVLELFIPRMDEGNYFVRMPIQLINGSLLILMWIVLLHWKTHWTPITKTIFLFTPLVLVHAAIYAISSKFNISDFSGYIKFLLWTTSIIFFYEMMIKYSISKKVIGIYIATFILATSKKIMEASLFESESLGGGDTASLPLLFIIPLVLFYFRSNYRLVFLAVISILILFSLRRTTIIGFILCLPFIFHYVSAKLKVYHILLIGILFTFIGTYVWEYIGEAVIYRFESLLVGDKGGTEDSYGSGRSEFYLTVWNNWIGKDLFSFLFGNGLNSTNPLLMRAHNVQHAHNDFLEIAYTFGLLGAGIWLFFIRHLWGLKKQIKAFNPESTSLFYICFISYLIIAMASGCIERITTLPFGITVSMLLYQVQTGIITTRLVGPKKSQKIFMEYVSN